LNNRSLVKKAGLIYRKNWRMKCTEFFGGPKNANYFPFFSLFFLLSSVLLCHNIFCFFLFLF